MFIIKVIPITKGFNLDTLTYFSVKNLKPGMLVTVPLRKKDVLALVINVDPIKDLKSQIKTANFKIRNIIKIHKESPFSKNLIDTIYSLSKYSTYNIGYIINSLFPKHILNSIIDEKLIIKNFQKDNKIIENISINENYKEVLMRPIDERITFYKTRIREEFANKRSILICVPTLKDGKYFFDKLKKGIEKRIFILNSSIGKKKLLEEYRKIHSNEKPILFISTPKFISLMKEDTGLIIIENESSRYYYQRSKPFLDLRIFIEKFSKISTIKIIFAGSILRTETFYRIKEGELYESIRFSNNIFDLKKIEILELNKKEDNENRKEKKEFQIIAEKFVKNIKEAIKKKEKIFLFINRRGLAPTIICSYCNSILTCSDSKSPFILYKNKKGERFYVCYKSKKIKPAFDKCPVCNGISLKAMGIGIQGLIEETEKKFPNLKIFKIDSNSTKTEKKIREEINEFNKLKSGILIGTSLAVPYLEKIDKSIIISLDSIFSIPSYKINENILSIISEIYEKTKDMVFIQTRNNFESLNEIIIKKNVEKFYKNELNDRKIFGYPPFQTLIFLSRILKKENIKKESLKIEAILKFFDPDIFIINTNKKEYSFLNILIKVEREYWNIKNQNQKLYKLLEILNKNYHIKINPSEFI